MKNLLGLIGVGFIIYQFQLLKYLSPLWGKLQKDSDIQKVEQLVKPLAEKAKSDLGITTPSPIATPSPTTPATPKYGVQLKIKTPVGSVQSGFGVSPETKKDLGVKKDE